MLKAKSLVLSLSQAVDAPTAATPTQSIFSKAASTMHLTLFEGLGFGLACGSAGFDNNDESGSSNRTHRLESPRGPQFCSIAQVSD